MQQPALFQTLPPLYKTDGTTGSKAMLGLSTYSKGGSETVQWVDELNPPIKVTYDEINQRLQFTVDRTVLGTGTDSNFNSFTVYGKSTATDTNNLGLVSKDDSQVPLLEVERYYLVKVLLQTVKKFNLMTKDMVSKLSTTVIKNRLKYQVEQPVSKLQHKVR